MTADLVTRAAFARLLNVNKSTVTRWQQAGRLVLSADGRVHVAASRARLAATAGTRDDVADRHAQARAAAQAPNAAPDDPNPIPPADLPASAPPTAPPAAAQAAPPAAAPPEFPIVAGLDARLELARTEKAMAESRRVIAAADREQLELDRLRGSVIARDQVDLAFREIGASLRALVDTLPDQVAPLVAPASDLDDCHAILAQAGRDLLTRFAEACERRAAALAQPAAA